MRNKLSIAIGLAIASSQAMANATLFDQFTAIPTSSGVIVNEAQGVILGNPGTGGTHSFTATSVASRSNQLAIGQPNSGNWDMITSNETGPDAGRYLFTVYETGVGGVQRTDTLNNYNTVTVWNSPGTAPVNQAAVFDASYWTPWGTFITAEENWSTAPAGATNNTLGRLFEMTNPNTAPSVTVANDNSGAQFSTATSFRARRTKVSSSTLPATCTSLTN